MEAVKVTGCPAAITARAALIFSTARFAICPLSAPALSTRIYIGGDAFFATSRMADHAPKASALQPCACPSVTTAISRGMSLLLRRALIASCTESSMSADASLGLTSRIRSTRPFRSPLFPATGLSFSHSGVGAASMTRRTSVGLSWVTSFAASSNSRSNTVPPPIRRAVDIELSRMITTSRGPVVPSQCEESIGCASAPTMASTIAARNSIRSKSRNRRKRRRGVLLANRNSIAPQRITLRCRRAKK